jgi:hypothetical protein
MIELGTLDRNSTGELIGRSSIRRNNRSPALDRLSSKLLVLPLRRSSDSHGPSICQWMTSSEMSLCDMPTTPVRTRPKQSTRGRLGERLILANGELAAIQELSASDVKSFYHAVLVRRTQPGVNE